MTTRARSSKRKQKTLPPRELAALRFLAACSWSDHSWASITAGIHVQLGDAKHLNGSIWAARELVAKGLATETPTGNYQINQYGIDVLKETDTK